MTRKHTSLAYSSVWNYRAGRLTDGPYTSYDLNTLLQATAGERRAVLIGQGIYLSVLIMYWAEGNTFYVSIYNPIFKQVR